jgi:quercetin dioxygenase-like cupin family protein
MTVVEKSRLVAPKPGSIPYEAAVLKLWGDDTSGPVNDWIYVSNEKIQMITFSMAPGRHFAHSESHRTILRADELYYVLSGTLVMANPQTGEVHRLDQGEAVRFSRDTWHHGYAYGSDTVRVLEFFAPPPATGTSQPYARSKPYLESATYVQDKWLGRWPQAAAEKASGDTMHVIRPEETLWRLEGEQNRILVGISWSTDELTTGVMELQPGQSSDMHVHGGDEAGFVLEGRLNVLIPSEATGGSANGWFEMDPDDAYLVPAGAPHRYYNMTGSTVRFMFGVAPRYLAE